MTQAILSASARAGTIACVTGSEPLLFRSLENIAVSLWHSRIHARDCEECETKDGMVDRIDVELELTGPLTSEQHAKLMEIAGKCPVHRTLTSEINIRLRAGEKSLAS